MASERFYSLGNEAVDMYSESRENSSYRSSHSYYTTDRRSGAARSLDAAPDLSPKQPKRRPAKKRRPPVVEPLHPERHLASSVDLLGLLVLGISLIIVLYTCILYFNVQGRIRDYDKRTAKFVTAAQNLRDKNDAAEDAIYESINLASIRKQAINDLGMIYPYDSQVVNYKDVQKGYVRQYDTMESASEENFMDMVLRLFVASRGE